MAMSQIVWSLDDKKPLMSSSLKDEKELEDLLDEHIDILRFTHYDMKTYVIPVGGRVTGPLRSWWVFACIHD